MRCLIAAAALAVLAWIAVLVVGVARIGAQDPVESVAEQFGGFGNAPVAQRALHWTVGRKAVAITRVAKVEMPPQPSGVATLPDGTIAVASRGGQSLVLVDPRGLSVIAQIPVGGAASGLAVGADGQYAWVTLDDCNRLVAVDLGSRKVTAEVGVGKRPFGPVAPRSGAVVLVPCAGSADLAVVDSRSAQLAGTIALGRQPVSVVAHPTRSLAYVAVSQSPALLQVDWLARTVASQPSLAGTPASVTATSDGDTLLAPISHQRALVVVDRLAGRVRATCDLPGVAREHMALGPNGRDLFVDLAEASGVAVVDLLDHTSRLVGTLDEPTSGLALSDDARRLYAIEGESGALCVYEIGYQ